MAKTFHVELPEGSILQLLILLLSLLILLLSMRHQNRAAWLFSLAIVIFYVPHLPLLQFFSAPASQIDQIWQQWISVVLFIIGLEFLIQSAVAARGNIQWVQRTLLEAHRLSYMLFVPVALLVSLPQYPLFVFILTGIALSMSLLWKGRVDPNLQHIPIVLPILLQLVLLGYSVLAPLQDPLKAPVFLPIATFLLLGSYLWWLYRLSSKLRVKVKDEASYFDGVAKVAEGSSQALPENISSPTLLQQFRKDSLATLTYGISQELINPLAIITGNQYRLQSLILKQRMTPEEGQKSLDKIGRAVKRVLSVIDALRIYSQQDHAEELNSSINIRETLQLAIDLCQERFRSVGVKLITQPFPDLYILGNQSLLMQSILILIENSLNALESARYKEIRIEYRQSVTHIEISIIDSGSGVDKKIAKNIFDPFFTTRKLKGHQGLGLSMAKGIIEMHKGTVYLNKGHTQTCFTIRLLR